MISKPFGISRIIGSFLNLTNSYYPKGLQAQLHTIEISPYTPFDEGTTILRYGSYNRSGFTDFASYQTTEIIVPKNMYHKYVGQTGHRAYIFLIREIALHSRTDIYIFSIFNANTKLVVDVIFNMNWINGPIQKLPNN